MSSDIANLNSFLKKIDYSAAPRLYGPAPFMESCPDQRRMGRSASSGKCVIYMEIHLWYKPIQRE